MSWLAKSVSWSIPEVLKVDRPWLSVWLPAESWAAPAARVSTPDFSSLAPAARELIPAERLLAPAARDSILPV